MIPGVAELLVAANLTLGAPEGAALNNSQSAPAGQFNAQSFQPLAGSAAQAPPDDGNCPMVLLCKSGCKP